MGLFVEFTKHCFSSEGLRPLCFCTLSLLRFLSLVKDEEVLMSMVSEVAQTKKEQIGFCKNRATTAAQRSG